jgi:hypothetical protein
VIYQPEI